MNNTVNTHVVNVNAKELCYVLESTPCTHNIMVMGKHGIGKSELMKKFFESKGKKVVPFFCSQAADPGDIIGLPRYNETTGKTEFALPWWFPTDNSPIVLFLDEINRARPEILQVVMDLTLNRTLAGKKLPEGSMVISAINEGDEYQLTDLDPALLSRFNLYRFVPTVNDWIMWAESNGVHKMVISFIKTHQNMLEIGTKEDSSTLEKTPDRRAWVRVSDMMHGNYCKHAMFKKVVCGVVGLEAGVRFCEYVAKMSKFTPELLINDPKETSRLKDMSLKEITAFNDELCSYVDLHYDDENIKEEKLVDALEVYIKTLSSEYREAFMHFVSNYGSGAYPNLNVIVAEHPEELDYVIQNCI